MPQHGLNSYFLDKYKILCIMLVLNVDAVPFPFPPEERRSGWGQKQESIKNDLKTSEFICFCLYEAFEKYLNLSGYPYQARADKGWTCTGKVERYLLI